MNLIENDSAGISFEPSGFCIMGFSDGIAQIRFVASEYMGYNHNRHLQLGFELPVKKEALKFFEQPSNFFRKVRQRIKKIVGQINQMEFKEKISALFISTIVM